MGWVMLHLGSSHLCIFTLHFNYLVLHPLIVTLNLFKIFVFILLRFFSRSFLYLKFRLKEEKILPLCCRRIQLTLWFLNKTLYF